VPHSVPNMTARTPGALLNNAETPREVLDATEALILPGTETRHETQWVHQKKRRKSAALALSKLADMLVGSGASNRRTQILQDHLFERLIQLTAVAARSEPSEAVDVVEEALFNARCSAQALRALAVLAPVSGLASSTLEELMREVLQGTGGGRTGGAGGLSGAELSGVCWAVQHLGAADSATAAKLVEVRQIEPIQLGGGGPCACREMTGRVGRGGVAPQELGSQRLPFGITVGGVAGVAGLSELRAELEGVVRSEVLVTRDGKQVTERCADPSHPSLQVRGAARSRGLRSGTWGSRDTCWMADPGIGGLAYRLMPSCAASRAPSSPAPC
jgi:hypothetical protein